MLFQITIDADVFEIPSDVSTCDTEQATRQIPVYRVLELVLGIFEKSIPLTADFCKRVFFGDL